MTTLNDMTPEALRDLVLRANATADGKEMAQQQIEKLRKEREADKEAKRKAEKDIIPPAGTFWRYNDRVWTVAANDSQSISILLSADKDGNDIRYWFFYPRHKMFSDLCTTFGTDALAWNAGGHHRETLFISMSRNWPSIQAAVGRLVLTARDIK